MRSFSAIHTQQNLFAPPNIFIFFIIILYERKQDADFMDNLIFNYEDIVRDLLLENLKHTFDIDDEDVLMLYLITRYYCVHGKYTENIDPRDFMEFIVRELGIVSHREGILFTYRTPITITYLLKNENSLMNIYEEFMYRLKNITLMDRRGKAIKNIHVELKQAYSNIHKNAMTQFLKHKDSDKKESIKLLMHLQELNKFYQIANLKNPMVMEYFEQEENLLVREIALERYLHAAKMNSNSFKDITEAQLRDFLFDRLELIEDGLSRIEKEYQLKEGRVDILAKDKNENIVIIELKIENDKRLIWQCLYYPEEVKKKYPKRNVRMMTIAPEYPDYLLGPLNHIAGVEKFKVSVVSTNGALEEVKLDKL